ncbi:SIR2 family protein [Pseudomonas sp. SA3-5]|uniref:SIR2 family protein n=1 Tax=Pseudomonas aestuarii TaxID=3018340 RepID=A0ABT4XGE2_9PSED|nr:SIR2 family protein [Pseudomonas aestuarii]MDA7087252.1 SIR2 family protein [Pseudomonas aestuarii]
MAVTPTANDIAVREVLEKLESEFASAANAVANGEFAVWVGSGISRQAPNLGNLIERAFDYIRERAIAAGTAAAYMPALEEALGLAEVEPATVQAQYGQPLAYWPEHDTIIDRLWNKYARVLDIRIAGTAADFILWDAIDIRQAFQDPAPPAAEHLCIAILILEGAVQSIASANWDGFIEAAVDRLSNRVPGVMQVVVDPGQLRGPAGRARLLKFHGCIEHAAREPSAFRRFLTGSYTQIMDWPEKPEFLAMCNAVVGLATAQKTLVLGLSIQDNNLQTLFARAKAAHAWPWPCAPAAPAHIFCEDRIQQGQRDVLRLSYGDAYNENAAAIHEATLLRAWGEKVLIALVLKVLGDKLSALMELTLTALGKGLVAGELEPLLKAVRDDIAELAVPAPGAHNRTDIVNQAITLWSRMLSLFRSGRLPISADAYETLSNSTLNLIATDQNAQAAGLGRLGVALSLLQYGRTTGLWEIHKPVAEDLKSGAITACALRLDGTNRPIFVVKSATEAIALNMNGGFADGNAIILHADDAWHQMVGSGASARRVRSAPGRTGRVGETHVSLGNLLANCGDAATLQQEFVKEMML